MPWHKQPRRKTYPIILEKMFFHFRRAELVCVRQTRQLRNLLYIYVKGLFYDLGLIQFAGSWFSNTIFPPKMRSDGDVTILNHQVFPSVEFLPGCYGHIQKWSYQKSLSLNCERVVLGDIFTHGLRPQSPDLKLVLRARENSTQQSVTVTLCCLSPLQLALRGYVHEQNHHHSYSTSGCYLWITV